MKAATAAILEPMNQEMGRSDVKPSATAATAATTAPITAASTATSTAITAATTAATTAAVIAVVPNAAGTERRRDRGALRAQDSDNKVTLTLIAVAEELLFEEALAAGGNSENRLNRGDVRAKKTDNRVTLTLIAVAEELLFEEALRESADREAINLEKQNSLLELASDYAPLTPTRARTYLDKALTLGIAATDERVLKVEKALALHAEEVALLSKPRPSASLMPDLNPTKEDLIRSTELLGALEISQTVFEDVRLGDVRLGDGGKSKKSQFVARMRGALSLRKRDPNDD
jgi:hypothetical protein